MSGGRLLPLVRSIGYLCHIAAYLNIWEHEHTRRAEIAWREPSIAGANYGKWKKKKFTPARQALTDRRRRRADFVNPLANEGGGAAAIRQTGRNKHGEEKKRRKAAFRRLRQLNEPFCCTTACRVWRLCRRFGLVQR